MDKIGKFEILEKIGRGAFGMVYKGKDPTMNRMAAIKVMGEATVGDPELVARFKREAEAAGGLSHRNIVTIYELGEHHGLPYIAMEFLEGKDLERILKEKTELSLDRRIEIVIQAAEGLHYAHTRGIVHRDVKPGNIRLIEDGSVKIMDFGIAKMSSSDMTKTGQFMGTVNYMSPEQIKAKKIDGRSDLFALGVVFYELVSARRPFPGDSITAVIYKIVNENPPPLVEVHATPYAWLEGVILKCLEKDVNKRWPSCQALADALRERTQVSVTLTESNSDRTLSVVRQRTDSGDIDGALRELDKWLDQDPDNETAIRERKSIQAVQAVKQAESLAAQGRLEQAQDVLAMCVLEVGQIDELTRAQARLEEKAKGGKASQLLETASRYIEEKRYEAAVDLLKQARDLDRYNEKVRDTLVRAQDEQRKANLALLLGDARARLERGQAAEAEAQIKKALELDPHSLEAKELGQTIEREIEVSRRQSGMEQAVQAGNLALKKADFDTAIKAFEKALALDPKSAEAQRLLEAAKQDKLKTDEKRAVVEHVDSGKKLLSQKRFDEARLSFERALKLDPAWGDARLGVAAAKARQTSIEAAARKWVPAAAIGAVAVVALIAIAVVGWLMTRPSEAAKAIREASAAAGQGQLLAARDLFQKAAVDLPGKDAERNQAKASYCKLYDPFFQSAELQVEAKAILDQCRAWKVGDVQPTRYLDLAGNLAERARQSADPALVKAASASYQAVFADGYDKRERKTMEGVYSFAKDVLERAGDLKLEPVRRLELYAAAQDLFAFVDKSDVSFSAYEDGNRARLNRVELEKLNERLTDFKGRADALVKAASDAEKDEANWDQAIRSYDELLKLVAQSRDLGEHLDLGSYRDLAEGSRDGLEKRRAAQVSAAGHEQKVALLLKQAGSLEEARDLKGALDKYRDLLREDAGNATAGPKVAALEAALGRAVTLKGEARGALGVRDAAAAEKAIGELATLVSDADVAALQAEFSRLKTGQEQAAAVAARFEQADAELQGGRLDQAEALYKEIAGSTTGALSEQATQGIKKVREARVKAQLDPLLASADALKGQGKIAEALAALKQAQAINATYPGLRERMAELQKPLIDEKEGQFWTAFDGRERDAAGFDRVTRELRELAPSHRALAEVEAWRKAGDAIASLNPAGAIELLRPYASDPRMRTRREQAEAMRGGVTALEAAERAIAARDRDVAVASAEQALREAGKINVPSFARKAQDTLERARAVTVAAAATPTPVAVVEKTPPPPTPTPAPAAAGGIPGEVRQAAAGGRWAEAATLLDQHLASGGSAEATLAGKIFFNAAHAAVCDGGCDLPASVKWAQKAVAQDPSTQRWLSTVGRFKTCDVNLKQGCNVMPKRPL